MNSWAVGKKDNYSFPNQSYKSLQGRPGSGFAQADVTKSGSAPSCHIPLAVFVMASFLWRNPQQKLSPDKKTNLINKSFQRRKKVGSSVCLT